MGRKYNILVVDDDVDLASNLQDVLEVEGYSITAAYDGKTALTLCRRKPFDLAIVDIKLPDMLGVELVDELATVSPENEYVIITAYASLDSAIEAVRRKNILAYETKPLNMDRFVAIITRWSVGKRVEEELQRERQKAQRYLDVAGVLILVIDSDQKVSLINNKGCQILGCEEKEIIGKNWFDTFIPERVRDEVEAVFEKLMTGEIEPVEYYENPVLTSSGEERIIAWHNTVLTDEAGNTIGTLSSGEDITEGKRMEEERMEMEQRAQQASRLAAIGEMASGVAHEINNPLTTVIGLAQLIMHRDIPEDIESDVKTIADNAQRIADIVKRLLTFTRPQEPEREYIDINDVIKSTLAIRAYEMETSNIKVAIQLDPDLPLTMADGSQLQQVFLNIVMNADTEMRLAHGKGNLFIKTETIDDTIRVSFKDDGPGIAKENLQKIFDPFFTTREVGKGTGLGLSICHRIVTEHNGQIYTKSRLGRGATFFIELPVVTKAQQLKLAELAAEESKGVPGAKILVVDDEPGILRFLSILLRGEGYEVETLDNANDALDRLKSKTYDLILLDIKLRGMSGIELYQRTQKIAESIAKSIVFITGDVEGALTRDFLSKTKAQYLAKPFDTEKLKNDIRRMLTEKIQRFTV